MEGVGDGELGNFLVFIRYILLHDGPKETDKSDEPKEGRKLHVLQSAIAISVSFTICKLATYVTQVFGIQGGNLPCITAIIVILATIFPAQFGALAPAGEAIAFILMQIVVHLALILGLGKLFGFEKKILLIASNANVGGPTTACGMATVKGWNSLIIFLKTKSYPIMEYYSL
ncbi:hypothetical protein M5K25_023735 [Dendrobium thyrsiflorum]|uniref:Uncharacterized protein n=1 Tax=Dendrobium thyrsiflorum TaxID=117978 RepID=A0ABD0U0B5_DENTH